MAVGYWGKARMGQRNTAKPPPVGKAGPTPAVGGPRPDKTASWPGNPGKENTAPGAKLGLPLVKTFVAGSYMPGNPKGAHGKKGLSQHKAKVMLEEGTAQGHPLTKKQKGLFGLIAGGGSPSRLKR